MDIVQIDSKTIKIVKNGFTFCLRYCFAWDKALRTPESIVRENNVIKAFFLTSVIKDTINENEEGFTISRLWNIVPGGEIALFFTIDLLLPKNVPCFFPSILDLEHVPQKQIMISGERLTFPSSVFLYPDGKSILFALDIPKTKEEQASIGVMRTNLEGIPSVRVDIAFPPREHLEGRFASIPGFVPGPEELFYASEGNLMKQTELNVLIAPEKEIFPMASAFFLRKNPESESSASSVSKGNAVKLVKEGIDICLNELLINKDGAYGPLVSQKSDAISSYVCSGLSYLLQKVFENNFEMNEISLKLADFCLKSQHPNGAFLEYYYVQQKTWSNNGRQDANRLRNDNDGTRASMEHSARIADFLFSIYSLQKEKGIDADKYFAAGKRFIEMFYDPKKRGLSDLGATFALDSLEPYEKSKLCLELIFPLINIYKITDDEKYKKAVNAIKSEFFGEAFSYTALPAGRDGDEPDFATALLLLKTATSLEDIGIHLKDKEVFVNMILPWIYFNRSGSAIGPDTIHKTRGVIESYDKCRIAYRGFELAYYLLKLNAMIEKKPLVKLVKNIASYLIDSGTSIRLGVPWFHHTLYNNEPKEKNIRPIEGEFDSRQFVREACYFLGLSNDFSEMMK